MKKSILLRRSVRVEFPWCINNTYLHVKTVKKSRDNNLKFSFPSKSATLFRALAMRARSRTRSRCSFRAAAAETSNPVFLLERFGACAQKTPRDKRFKTQSSATCRRCDRCRAYCTRHNDDTEENSRKTWEHARQSAREGGRARDSNESDADEDDGIKRVEGGSILREFASTRVISPRFR